MKASFCLRLKASFPGLVVLAGSLIGSVLWAQDTTGPTIGSSARRGLDLAALDGTDVHRYPVALRGFCPVCLVETRQWLRGNPQFTTVYDGRTYFFPEQKQLRMFQARPEKYVPALGGDDVVEYFNTGRRIRGGLDHGARHDGRLFFFASDENKRTFLTNPDKFADVDLVLGGDCVVSRKEADESVPGMPATTVVHRGLRYQFAGPDERDMFLAAPDEYAEFAAQLPAEKEARNPSDSGGQTESGSGGEQ